MDDSISTLNHLDSLGFDFELYLYTILHFPLFSFSRDQANFMSMQILSIYFLLFLSSRLSLRPVSLLNFF